MEAGRSQEESVMITKLLIVNYLNQTHIKYGFKNHITLFFKCK